MHLFGRRFAGILFLTGALGLSPSPADAQTLQAELDRNFSSVAQSCLGSKFKPGNLKKRAVYGREIRTAVPDDFLEWDPIKDYLFKAVAFNNDGALDLEFAKVLESVGGDYKQVGTELELFWSKSDRPMFAQFNDSVVREHNCITLVKGTSSFDVSAGFLSAAADASVDSQRAVTTFAYAGRVLSPYAWAAGMLSVDGSTVRPSNPRVSYLLRMWEWYGRNPSAVGKSLIISTEITGIALFKVKQMTQNTMMETQAHAGFGMGPFSASANAEAELRSYIQSKVVDFGSALLKRDATNYLPQPEQLARMIRDEIRLSPSPENVGSVGAGSIPFVATLPYMTKRLCVQSAWRNASVGGFTAENFSVEPTATGGCKFALTLVPPAVPKEDLTLAFAVETPVTSASGSSTLKFELPRESFSDNRLLINFDTRPLDGITLAARPLVDGRDYDLEFVVRERGGARLGDVQNGASRAAIACGHLPPRNLPLNSAAAETSANTKLLRLRTRIDAGLLNSIEQGQVVECSVTAAVFAERHGPGAGSHTFNLPTARFVVRKESPSPAPVVTKELSR